MRIIKLHLGQVVTGKLFHLIHCSSFLTVFLSASALIFSTALMAEDVLSSQTNSSQLKSPLIKLNQLNQQGKFDQAYKLALELRPNWEGDSQYDVQFAIAAARTSHENEAIFTLLRLLDQQPNNYSLRLELARCYYFSNQLNSAAVEFTKLRHKLKNSSDNKSINKLSVKQHYAQIKHFQKRIAYQQQQLTSSWNTNLKLGLGYDSNINSAANIDTINATFFYNNEPALTGILSLNDQQKTKGSGYTKLQANSHYSHPINKRSLVDVSAVVAHKDNTQEDLTQLNLQAGYKITRNQHSLRTAFAHNHYWLAGDHLHNQMLTSLAWQWAFSAGWQTSTTLEVGQQNNSENKGLNVNQWQGKLAISHKNSTLMQRLQLSSGKDKARKAEYAFHGRNYYSLGYQLQSPIQIKQHVYAGVNYRVSDFADTYANDHVFFANKTRHDSLLQFIAGWAYQINTRTAVNLNASHRINHSNLALFDYQRSLIETGLLIAF